MMERDFYSDDFERLIREKTEQYKMYPSEKVWKGVYSSLHTKKRWFIGGMSILVTGIIVVAGRELILPSAHPGSLKKQPLTASLTTPKTTPENTVLPSPFTEYRGGGHSAAFTHNGHILGPLADVSLTAEEIRSVETPNAASLDGQQADPAAAIGQTLDMTAASSTVVNRTSARMGMPGAGMHNGNHASGFGPSANRPEESYAGYLSRMRTGNGLAFGQDPYAYEAPMVFATSTSFSGSLRALGIQIPLHSSGSNRLMSPLNATELIEPVNTGDDDDQSMEPDTSIYNSTGQKINWLQDYAVYNMHAPPRKNKVYWQMYITPDENVRMLSGAPAPNEKLNNPGNPISRASSANPNGFSKFLRNMGFATGAAIIYKISPTVSIKGGLQFNYSRFALSASPAGPGSPPQVPAANPGGLRDSAGGAGSAPSPASPVAQVLYNEYFQLSAPVGVELRVWGNDRLQINIAATVQPAYMVNTNAYLLATEGNNYVQMPSMFRKWNVDGGAEVFVSYKIGGLRLQVGPDFRYQFLSSYINRYPARENLASYGLKIGIIKAIR